MIIELLGLAGAGAFARKSLKKKPLVHALANVPKPLSQYLGNNRNQQLKEFSAGNINHKSPQQKQADLNMTLALSSLAVTATAKVFYPPLMLVCLPGILYVSHFAMRRAAESLRQKKLTIDLLSTINDSFLILHGYLVLASISICLFSLNRKFLNKISDNSKKNLIDVFKQQPNSVWVVFDGVECEIPFTDLKTGDIVVAGAGAVIPVDGLIIEGSAAIDQHILTGESQPVEKTQGEDVFALTLVLSGKIYVQTQKAGEETTAAQIANILNNTISTKTDIQLWSQKVSDETVLPTLILSALILPFLGAVSAMTIIISHFKYRTTMSSAIGVLKYLNLASHNGILIKDGHTFELLKKIDTVVFDKTGTLTEELPKIACIYTCGAVPELEVLRIAAAAETRQPHPIAKAILQRAEELQLELPEVEDTAYKLGYGLTVRIEGRTVWVGSVRFLEQENISVPPQIQQVQADHHEQGSPVVIVAVDTQVTGAIVLEASIRPGTHELIKELRGRGITSTYIISGDHQAPTRKLAKELSIDHYFAETLPEQKAELIAMLQAEGKSVCYVGDGINDSIALKQADVSISIRGASSAATDAAQIILMDKTLQQLPYLFDMGHHFNGHMRKVVAAVIIPSVFTTGSALFLHVTLLQALLLPQIGLIAGVATAMHPNIKQAKLGRKTSVKLDRL